MGDYWVVEVLKFARYGNFGEKETNGVGRTHSCELVLRVLAVHEHSSVVFEV